MKSRTVTVVSLDGEEKPAELIVCPECHGQVFMFFVLTINGNSHNHMQCAVCSKTYCDNKCAIPT